MLAGRGLPEVASPTEKERIVAYHLGVESLGVFCLFVCFFNFKFSFIYHYTFTFKFSDLCPPFGLSLVNSIIWFLSLLLLGGGFFFFFCLFAFS